MRSSSWLGLVIAGASACRPSETPSRVTEPIDAPITAPPPAFREAPLAIAVRVDELCDLATLATLIGMTAPLPVASKPVLETRTGAVKCAIVLAPNLVDYVAIIPGATVSGSAGADPEDIAAIQSGDVVAIGRRRVLDQLDELSPLVEWSGLAELEAAGRGAWANGIGRFDVAAPISGHASEPALTSIGVALTEAAIVFEVRGDPAVVEDVGAQIRGHLERLAALDADGRARAIAAGDPIEALALTFGVVDAFAKGRVRFDVTAGHLALHIDAGTVGVTRAAMLGGLISALFGPTMIKYHRRGQTAEPRIELARMFDAAVAAMYADPEQPETFRGCPSNDEAQVGWTPSLDVRCARGRSGRCSIGSDEREGSYSAREWDAPTWHTIGFAVTQPHRFHYNLRATFRAEEPTGCQFTAQAFGDLDDDGVFSTFERAAAANRIGVNAGGLYIDNEVE